MDEDLERNISPEQSEPEKYFEVLNKLPQEYREEIEAIKKPFAGSEDLLEGKATPAEQLLFTKAQIADVIIFMRKQGMPEQPIKDYLAEVKKSLSSEEKPQEENH
jgi:hypothetical protein